MKEIWKDIQGFEGLYQVSTHGRIRSLNYNRTGITQALKQTKTRDGYLKVVLHKDGKQKTFLVHRLIAEAFISNPNSYPEVNHMDENKENNCVSNLEWCSRMYNMNYGTGSKRATERIQKPIYCVELNRIFESATQAGIELDLTSQNITACCRGRINRTGGYHFKYAD